MKDKALEKLSKNELLELMLYLRKEYDKLNAENEKLLQKLEDKKSITDRLDRLEHETIRNLRFYANCNFPPKNLSYSDYSSLHSQYFSIVY